MGATTETVAKPALVCCEPSVYQVKVMAVSLMLGAVTAASDGTVVV